ncbi:MAG: SulP family inorganic anion transporter [Terricaulis sp.]
MNTPSQQPTFAELFTPKLVTVLREGYGAAQLRADAIAGLTVAIVALPLSMAIAIASGVSPAQGLITAIVGGFLVSALGGSRFQVGGPAGAFIVLVTACVSAHGVAGLVVAVFMSGFMLAALGWLRLGAYIKFIPYPVTVGFTAGIAVIILASQVKELFGLTLGAPEPGALLEKIPMLWGAAGRVNVASTILAAAVIAAIFVLKRYFPRWPGLLIAVVGASLAAALLHLPVDTIDSRFGALPHFLPAPSLPDFRLALDVLPNALSFTLLGAIESLLSAVVADGMTGRRHRSNCELVAQGAANVGSALFGGICVTGTIARTATNVRAGAHGPVSGMLHALFLLVLMLAAAPLAGFIPMAALAAVLVTVAWNMAERRAIASLLSASRGDAIVLAATFGLTIFRDLSEAIVVGFALGSLLFINRMSKVAAVTAEAPFVQDDKADEANGRGAYDEGGADPEIVVYRISGAFFFGAAASIGAVLERIGETHRALVVDFAAVPYFDSTAARTIESLARAAARRGVRVYLTGASAEIRRELTSHGVDDAIVRFEMSIESALRDIAKQG